MIFIDLNCIFLAAPTSWKIMELLLAHSPAQHLRHEDTDTAVSMVAGDFRAA
jgi:hypothetical protein